MEGHMGSRGAFCVWANLDTVTETGTNGKQEEMMWYNCGAESQYSVNICGTSEWVNLKGTSSLKQIIMHLDFIVLAPRDQWKTLDRLN